VEEMEEEEEEEEEEIRGTVRGTKLMKTGKKLTVLNFLRACPVVI